MFGEEFAVVGVIAATILTNIFICHIVEPHVLYKYGLQRKTTKYYIRNYVYIGVFTLCLVALHFAMRSYATEWKELLVNGSIAVALAIVPSIAAMFADRDFRHYFKHILNKLSKKKVPAAEGGNSVAEEGIVLEEVQAEADVSPSENLPEDSNETSEKP